MIFPVLKLLFPTATTNKQYNRSVKKIDRFVYTHVYTGMSTYTHIYLHTYMHNGHLYQEASIRPMGLLIPRWLATHRLCLHPSQLVNLSSSFSLLQTWCSLLDAQYLNPFVYLSTEFCYLLFTVVSY